MPTKQALLDELREGLRAGVLTEADLRAITAAPAPQTVVADVPLPSADDRLEKLSAVDIMFYVAGLVLFAAIMSGIVQSWNSSGAVVRVALSLGLGLGFWTGAYVLITGNRQSDIRQGLVNALILTGMLLNIVGAYIVTYQIVGEWSTPPYIPAALTLAVLSLLHFVYDRFVQKDLVLLAATVLGVGVFPVLMTDFLAQLQVAPDWYVLLTIASAALLVYATRVVAKAHPYRRKVRRAFDGLAAFSALLSMYSAGFGDYGVVWTCVLLASVIGLFYVSIVRQDKRLLGIGAVFMTLEITTVSFRYFSGFGVTTSLIVATAGLLGTAAVAASINRKYFKLSPVNSIHTGQGAAPEVAAAPSATISTAESLNPAEPSVGTGQADK